MWEEPPQNPTNLEEHLLCQLHMENKDLEGVLSIKRTLEKLAREGNIDHREANIQHAFERYTERWLKESGLSYTRPSPGEKSDFDFRVQNGRETVCLEVKSDRYWYTGNISLELIRDYRSSFIDPLNAGSLVKTQAHLWQVYYYDDQQGKFDAKVFRVSKLLEKASYVLEHLGKQQCT
ncbi:hypothetical protein TJA_22520 [Thermus sp. LT1-2-5]